MLNWNADTAAGDVGCGGLHVFSSIDIFGVLSSCSFRFHVRSFVFRLLSGFCFAMVSRNIFRPPSFGWQIHAPKQTYIHTHTHIHTNIRTYIHTYRQTDSRTHRQPRNRHKNLPEEIERKYRCSEWDHRINIIKKMENIQHTIHEERKKGGS